MSTYILQKDLPDVKAGEKFELGKSMDAYYLASNKTETKYNCYAYPVYFVENNPEWFKKEEQLVRPPIGLKPLWLVKEQRLRDIQQAISRFNEANYAIPEEWQIEIKELTEWLNKYLPSRQEKKYTAADMRKCWDKAREKASPYSGSGYFIETFEGYLKQIL